MLFLGPAMPFAVKQLPGGAGLATALVVLCHPGDAVGAALGLAKALVVLDAGLAMPLGVKLVQQGVFAQCPKPLVVEV